MKLNWPKHGATSIRFIDRRLSFIRCESKNMRMTRPIAIRVILATLAWMSALVVGRVPCSLAQAPLSANPAPTQNVSAGSAAPTAADEELDRIFQRSAAARLLAEMGPNTPVDTKVSRLIERLVLPAPEQVQAAVAGLAMLGPQAVPAMIRRLDDRRDMKVHHVMFENRGPQAFEGIAHYGPAKVIDCLSLVLSDLTGEFHGCVQLPLSGNDGLDQLGPGLNDPEFRRHSDEERGEMLRGWRGYLAKLKPTPRLQGRHCRSPGCHDPVAERVGAVSCLIGSLPCIGPPLGSESRG